MYLFNVCLKKEMFIQLRLSYLASARILRPLKSTFLAVITWRRFYSFVYSHPMTGNVSHIWHDNGARSLFQTNNLNWLSDVLLVQELSRANPGFLLLQKMPYTK